LAGRGQRIRGRPAGHADLQECTSLLPAWLQLDDRVRRALPAIWTRLLGSSGFNADVIEDLARPGGQRLLGLGMAIALPPAWQHRMRDEPPPCVASELYRALLDGDLVPLDDKALAAANAAGEVAFAVLHYHQRLTDLSDPDTLQLLAAAMALFRGAHAGWRLSALYQQGCGPEGEYLLSMGFRARTLPAEPAGPVVYGLLREEAERQLPGTPVRDAFQFVPPLMGFSGSQRRQLRLAVADLTDEQIGDELGLSAHTVKKLWRTIHQRAAERMPDLFEETAAPAAEIATRGPEKRRSLLQYLRQHPEELRPYARDSRDSRG
jgi:DNA-binding CsgD family transcriptional regulator